MRRRRSEIEERRVEQLLGPLFRRSPRLTEQVLRRMARSAAAEPRLTAKGPGRSRWVFSRRFTGVAIGIALVVGSGLGFSVGSSFTPDGSAAQGPVGLGFLPADGWNVLQSGALATPEHPAYAVAANGPIDPEDVVEGGLPDPSGLPYATLLKLRPQDIVIVATFTKQVSPERYGPMRFAPARLPLHIGDVTPYPEYGTLIRPEQPLGQYQFQVGVNGYDVDVDIYFGAPEPPPALVRDAQGQLDRLVVRAPRDRRTAGIAAPLRQRVVDRTLLCATGLSGGVREIELRAFAGIRESPTGWRQLPYAVVSTGTTGARLRALDNSLAWVTAGVPSGTTTMDTGFNLSWPHTSGTVALNRRVCRESSASVPLTAGRLSGGPSSAFGDSFDCAAPRRVVVRVRAVFKSASGLHGDSLFVTTNTPTRDARLAVRTEAGKPLAYAEVIDSGKVRLFTGPSCLPD